VLLLRNLEPTEGLSNGTRLVIKELCENFIRAEIISESHRGETALFVKEALTTKLQKMPVTMERFQYALMPAFSMTINKSQGQTLDNVGLWLPNPVFSHGQLYTGMSRCKDSDKITVHIENLRREQGELDLNNKSRIFTINVVYHEVFVNNEHRQLQQINNVIPMVNAVFQHDDINDDAFDQQLIDVADGVEDQQRFENERRAEIDQIGEEMQQYILSAIPSAEVPWEPEIIVPLNLAPEPSQEELPEIRIARERREQEFDAFNYNGMNDIDDFTALLFPVDDDNEPFIPRYHGQDLEPEEDFDRVSYGSDPIIIGEDQIDYGWRSDEEEQQQDSDSEAEMPEPKRRRIIPLQEYSDDDEDAASNSSNYDFGQFDYKDHPMAEQTDDSPHPIRPAAESQQANGNKYSIVLPELPQGSREDTSLAVRGLMELHNYEAEPPNGWGSLPELRHIDYEFCRYPCSLMGDLEEAAEDWMGPNTFEYVLNDLKVNGWDNRANQI
jgi:hypothetical protein